MTARAVRCLLLCALAVVLCTGAALLVLRNGEEQKRAEALAVQQAAEAAASEAAAAEAALQAAAEQEAQRLAAEAAAKRAAQVQQAADRRETVQVGDALGTVYVEGTDISCPLSWGDSEAQFSLGAGCRATDGCVLPGENGTVFVGGHTGTFFADLGSTELGAIIHLATDWGDFTYRVTEMKIIEETDIDACYWGAEEPRCILYTCYPFGILTHTIYRYAVYAEPVAADEYGVLPAETAATAETAASAAPAA